MLFRHFFTLTHKTLLSLAIVFVVVAIDDGHPDIN